jgi:hypothetical protein
VESGPLGFDLGTIEQSTRTRRSIRRHWLHVAGGIDVYAPVDGDFAADTTLLAVSVPEARLVRCVVGPDGATVDAALLRVKASCHSEPSAWDPPNGAWRLVPVRVVVESDTYEPLTFDWTVAAADERHALVYRLSPK